MWGRRRRAEQAQKADGPVLIINIEVGYLIKLPWG